MDKRKNISILFMVIALLLCEFNLSVTADSYRLVSDAFSYGGAVQEQSISPVADTSSVDVCTFESVSGQYGSLQCIRSQTKGNSLQRTIVRILLFFAAIFSSLAIAFRYCKGRLYLPENAVTSTVILHFIHSKDGKK